MSNEVKTEKTEVVVREPVLEVKSEPSEAMSLMSPQEMGKQLTTETQKRKKLVKYINAHFKDGIDYGTINMKGFVTKPTLFKAGAEKFLSLFRLRVEYEKDNDTWEMLGSKSGTVCYLCKLYTMGSGVLVGEGRGSATVASSGKGVENKAIKMAQKRAKVDATLSTGGLSDFFTQDLEDNDTKTVSKPPTAKQLEEQTISQIKNSSVVSNLIRIDERCQASKKLSATAKERISTAVKTRVNEIEHAEQTN